MNTRTLIVVKGIHVSDEGRRSLMKRVDGFNFVTHRVSKLKDTIRGYSIRGSILSGISLQRGGFQKMAEEDAFYAFQHDYGVCADTPMPEDGGENPAVEQVRKRAKWYKDDYVCRGLILNGMYDSLFDIYQNVDTSKELWDALESKYIDEDASSKKFLVSNFTNYKMIDSRPVLEQYNELIGILGRFTQPKMNMDESIQVSCIIDKLSPSWKNFKHTLNHLKEELTLVELGSHLHIKESLRAQDNDKPKGNNVVGPLVVNMVEHNNSSRMMMLHGGLTQEQLCMCAKIDAAIDMDTEKCKTCMLTKITKKPFQNVKRETKVLELIHIDLCDLHATPSLGNKKYFVTFIDDASRFCYVYLLHSKDETKVELQQESLIKRFKTDRGACYLLNNVPNKRNKITPYELWTKRKPNLNYLRVWGCRAAVRLPDPKLKTLGKRGIECIFVGYAEHSKAFRFYVIEPNDSVAINSIIESRDAIFDKHRFSSVPRPSQRS
nr:zinc finger, CCHC-type [Tanacetum cinerariifolium]